MHLYSSGFAGSGRYQLLKIVARQLPLPLGFHCHFHCSMLSFYRYYRIEEKGPFAEYLNMQNDTEIEELVDSLSTLNHPILSLSPSVGRDLEI